jgi:F0F1-type ATP synthase assembly protein I
MQQQQAVPLAMGWIALLALKWLLPVVVMTVSELVVPPAQHFL